MLHYEFHYLISKGEIIMQEVETLITTVGFPIAMCLLFAWYIYKRDEKDSAKDLEHKQEVDNLSEAITNNTIVMEKILKVLSLKEGVENESK